MKKFWVIALMVASLVFAGIAEAAKPKKRTRNANRVGAYGAALVGNTSFKGDQTQNELDLIDLFDNQGVPARNAVASTEDSDIGYQVAFGYRFTRYIAAEIGLAQYGDLTSTVRGEYDLSSIGGGFVPARLDLKFSAGGPAISAIGILPLNDKFEFYARAGFLFSSSEREVSLRVDGEGAGSGSGKGDSTEPFLGVGFSWHLNQIYSIRAEYQKLTEVGENESSGTEELDFAAIGLVVRF